MLSHTTPRQAELFTSWKEIAGYLGKGVRTVQRWEQQFGLPVRRPNEKTKGVVHATRDELDLWLAMNWSQRGQDAVLPVRVDPKIYQTHEAVRSSIHDSVELRVANRQLLADMRRSLDTIHAECETLARHMTANRESS